MLATVDCEKKPDNSYELKHKGVCVDISRSSGQPSDDKILYTLSSYTDTGSLLWEIDGVLMNNEISPNNCYRIDDCFMCLSEFYQEGIAIDVFDGTCENIIDDGIISLGDTQVNIKYNLDQILVCGDRMAILDQERGTRSGSRVVIYDVDSNDIIDKKFGRDLFTIDCKNNKEIIAVRQRAKNYTFDV